MTDRDVLNEIWMQVYCAGLADENDAEIMERFHQISNLLAEHYGETSPYEAGLQDAEASTQRIIDSLNAADQVDIDLTGYIMESVPLAPGWTCLRPSNQSNN